MDIVPVDEVCALSLEKAKGLCTDVALCAPFKWQRTYHAEKQANIVRCLQEEQLESITFAQFRDWAHGPEGEQKDDGCVFCSIFSSLQCERDAEFLLSLPFSSTNSNPAPIFELRDET